MCFILVERVARESPNLRLSFDFREGLLRRFVPTQRGAEVACDLPRVVQVAKLTFFSNWIFIFSNYLLRVKSTYGVPHVIVQANVVPAPAEEENRNQKGK